MQKLNKQIADDVKIANAQSPDLTLDFNKIEIRG